MIMYVPANLVDSCAVLKNCPVYPPARISLETAICTGKMLWLKIHHNSHPKSQYMLCALSIEVQPRNNVDVVATSPCPIESSGGNGE